MEALAQGFGGGGWSQTADRVNEGWHLWHLIGKTRAFGDQLFQILAVKGIWDYDRDFPTKDVVMIARAYVKTLEQHAVRKGSDHRARRNKDAIFGSWLRDDKDKWQWLRVQSAPPLHALVDKTGTLRADAGAIDEIIREVWIPIVNASSKR